jgi:hypothetical protein
MKARKALSALVLFLVLLVLPTAYRYVTFYTGPAQDRTVTRPQLDAIQIPTPPAAQYADEEVVAGDGVVLVDMAHENLLQMPELNVLAGRLAARGHQLVSWDGENLKEALRDASAFLVAVPLTAFQEDEVGDVVDFVASGGRLLLLGDPTRYGYQMDEYGWITGIDSDAQSLNSLSAAFGITFVDDYLYNVVDNEGNFRNIKLSDWDESDLTKGVETVVFYAAHSLAVGEQAAAIRADQNTWSSATDRAGGLVVAAAAADSQVLAIGDLTFMTEPYHTVRDNSRLIANVADFLTGAERSYTLADFPLLMGEKVAFIYTNNPEMGPAQLQLVDEFEELLQEADRTLVLAEEPDSRTDTIFAGIYSQADPITDTLTEFGVTLVYTPTEEIGEGDETTSEEEEEQVEEELDEEAVIDSDVDGDQEEEANEQVIIDGLGTHDMSGIGLILHKETGRHVIVTLAASQQGLFNILHRLAEGDMYDCVQVEAITLCPTGVPDEEVEPSWEAREAPEAEPEPEPEEESDGELPEGVEGELSYGDSVEGELPAGEEHRWIFQGTEGDLVTIRLEALSSDMDPVLELVDAEDFLLIAVDDTLGGGTEEISNFELSYSGEFTIRVKDFYDEGGSYLLTLEQGELVETAGGSIDFGETVEGSLEAGQQAIWTFSGVEDQAVTIILQPDENSDMALELQDADGAVLDLSDEGFSGEEERIEGTLPADGVYQILVEEYWGEESTYELTLLEGGEGGVLGGSGILIVSADTGTATGEGQTSFGVYLDLLAEDYEVTVWTLSDDGEVDPEEMGGYRLVIWTSGDFQGGEDYSLYTYLLEGKPLLLSGSFPVFYEGGESAVLRDIQVSTEESLLTTGFGPGEIIELTSEMETVVFDTTEDDEGVTPMFLRGPASDLAGDMIAVGVKEEEFDVIHALIAGFPLYALPEWAQAQFVSNALSWFGISP